MLTAYDRVLSLFRQEKGWLNTDGVLEMLDYYTYRKTVQKAIQRLCTEGLLERRIELTNGSPSVGKRRYTYAYRYVPPPLKSLKSQMALFD